MKNKAVFEDEYDEHDFIEDIKLENGNYSHICIECGHEFIGHKRRLVCKMCKQSDVMMEEREKDV